MAGNGEKEVVMERRQFRKLVFEHLRDFGGALTLLLDAFLSLEWENLVGEFTKPGLEHGTNGVDVIEVGLFKQVDIEF